MLDIAQACPCSRSHRHAWRSAFIESLQRSPCTASAASARDTSRANTAASSSRVMSWSGVASSRWSAPSGRRSSTLTQSRTARSPRSRSTRHPTASIVLISFGITSARGSERSETLAGSRRRWSQTASAVRRSTWASSSAARGRRVGKRWRRSRTRASRSSSPRWCSGSTRTSGSRWRTWAMCSLAGRTKLAATCCTPSSWSCTRGQDRSNVATSAGSDSSARPSPRDRYSRTSGIRGHRSPSWHLAEQEGSADRASPRADSARRWRCGRSSTGSRRRLTSWRRRCPRLPGARAGLPADRGSPWATRARPIGPRAVRARAVGDYMRPDLP